MRNKSEAIFERSDFSRMPISKILDIYVGRLLIAKVKNTRFQKDFG